MNRLSEGAIELNDNEVFNNCSYSCYANIADALNILKAYENTGLEPEQIKQLNDAFINSQKKLEKTFDELFKFKDLEEQGLLIKLPSIPKNKTLYWIWGKEIMPVQFKGISHGAFNKKKEFHILCKMATKKDRTFTNGKAESTYKKGDIRYFYADEIGKTIFLTQEEAEKALEEMEGK